MSNIPYILEDRPDTGLNNSKLGIWIFLASEVMLFGGLFSAYVFLRIAAPEGDFDYWGSKLNVPMATFNTMVLITSSVTMVMSWASLKLQQYDKYKMYLGITILCGFAFLFVKYFEYSSKYHHKTITYIESPDGQELKNTGHIVSQTETEIIFKVDPSNNNSDLAEDNKPITISKYFDTNQNGKFDLNKNGDVIEEERLVRSIDWYGPHRSTFLGIYFTLTGLHVLHIIGGLFVLVYFWTKQADKMWEENQDLLANRIEITGLYWHFVDLVWIFLFPILYLL